MPRRKTRRLIPYAGKEIVDHQIRHDDGLHHDLRKRVIMLIHSDVAAEKIAVKTKVPVEIVKRIEERLYG